MLLMVSGAGDCTWCRLAGASSSGRAVGLGHAQRECQTGGKGSVLAAIRESWGGHNAGGLAEASERHSLDTSECLCWASEEHAEYQRVSERKFLSLVQL